MIAPVQDDGRWWAAGQRLEDDERIPLLESLEEQVRGRFPPSTEVHRSFLPCYPRHALLRFTVPGEMGPREGFAFYAGGRLYPLDWTRSTLRAFEDVALELRSAEQAEAFVRFVPSAIIATHGRIFVVESLDELRLRPGHALDQDVLAAVSDIVQPLESVPTLSDDEAYRFRGAFLHGGTLARCDIVVGPTGELTLDADASMSPVDVPVVDDQIETDQHFVLIRETSLTAERFLRRVRAGPVNQARVTEPVRLRGELFHESVHLSQVTFEKGADFTGARFEKGLAMEQCVVEGRMDLRDASVHGPLNAPGLRFHREGARKADGTLDKPTRYGTLKVDLDASGLRVEGSCYLEGLSTENGVDLSRVEIEGDLRLGGSKIGRARGPGADPDEDFFLRLDAASISGDLDLSWVRDQSISLLEPDPSDRARDAEIPGFSTPLCIVRGSIQGKGVRVGGDVSMSALRCEGNVWLGGAHIEGNLAAESNAPNRRTIVTGSFWAESSHIGGYVSLHGMYVGDGLQIFDAEIGGMLVSRTVSTPWGRVLPLTVVGQVDLSGTRGSDVEFAGASMGELRIVTGEFGRLRIISGLEERKPQAQDPPSDGPAPDEGRTNAEDGSTVRLVAVRSSRIAKVGLWDLTVRKRLAFRGEITGPLELGNVDCGGDVEFWNDQMTDESVNAELEADEAWAGGRPPSRFDQRTHVVGDLRCTGVSIGGRLVLTNLSVEGRILFKNCSIDQDLNCDASGPDPATAEGRTRTTCRHLDLELTSCGGDVDLAGLDIVDGGSLHARQLEVDGRILLARPVGSGLDPGGTVPADRTRRVEAHITGDVDLSVARAGQLVLTGSSIGGRANLERGSFRRLDVVEAWLLHGHNLSDIGVDRWEIPDPQLVTFLDRSEPFARATYVAIERMLRNKAQDADADRVYRAMRARAIREVRRDRPGGLGGTRQEGRTAHGPRGPEPWWTRAAAPMSYLLRTTGARLQGWLYGWGTLYWAPLLVFSLVTLPLTWWMLSTPENVTPSLELLAAADVPTDGAAPEDVGVDWGPSDGFWLTARYHVPVIPLAAREEFRPAPRPAILRLPGGSALGMVLSVEGYAFTVYLLSWILWPLFLVGLGRRVVRETT